ncbi:MAG: FkbM family methyltransferase [Candidatus Pacearchaeota archaeon]
MIINKENLTTYKNLFFQSTNKLEIIKYVIKRLAGINAKFDKDFYVKSEGHLMNCGKIMENCKNATINFEKEVTKAIIRCATNRETCIDVGANIGKHTLTMSKICKKVIAIEPFPENFRLLKQNTSSLKNVICYNLAASNKAGIISLNVNELHPARVSAEYPWERQIRVRADSLNNLLKKEKKVSFLKIDVEGHEYEVICGGIKIIKRDKPDILFEVWNEAKLKKIKDVLNPLGYSFKQVDCYNNFLAQAKK